MRLGDVDSAWDLIVIGGGVTGAGILREAIRSGLKTLLIESHDFAWGTSSRSSKLVHGGLRYLKEAKPLLTWHSVRERQRLIDEAAGLVERIDFLAPVYSGAAPGRFLLEAGLSVYSLMAFERQHRYFSAREIAQQTPQLQTSGLIGGFRFMDGQVDDARLVLRLIQEALADGGAALNYTAAREISRNSSGDVTGLLAEDAETGETRSLSTPAVINATGAWAETLHRSPNKNLHLRPLRGSHLIFPARLLPLRYAVSFAHPADQRPIFAVPWEGVILFGTTDVDHAPDMRLEPAISESEATYLMEGLSAVFPGVKLTGADCLAAIAGVRPVLSAGKKKPSQESREHVVWIERGLVTITGGKLTTFRLLAQDALKAAKPFLRHATLPSRKERIFNRITVSPETISRLDKYYQRRISGRYGAAAEVLLREATAADLNPIPETPNLWAEIKFAAKHEHIRHLTDLMLRRVRIGILTRDGGKEHLPEIQRICSPLLPWDQDRWRREIADYHQTWNNAHAIPKGY